MKIKGFTPVEVFSTSFADIFKPAFTLAEVLITLGIIGIVAAMTLPSILQKRERLSTVVALKKFYSSFQNAIIYPSLTMGRLLTGIQRQITMTRKQCMRGLTNMLFSI